MREKLKKLLLGSSPGRMILEKLLTRRARKKLKVPISIHYAGVWIHEHEGLNIAEWAPKTNLDPQNILAQLIDRWGKIYLPSKGENIVYIGAGVGGESIMFSRMVGENGKVLAVEAHPKTYGCLCKTVQLNDLSNVTTINLAVAETSKDIQIEDSEHHIGNAITKPAGSEATMTVKAERIDQICNEHGLKKIDLLAMNIEGAEKFAVKGMNEILDKTVRLAISCHDFKADKLHDEFFRTKADILDFIETSGFLVSDFEYSTPWDRDWVYAYNPSLVGQFGSPN